MASLLEALMGGYGGEQEYLAQDPFYMGGRSIMQTPVAPRTSTEALLFPALQGLLGGALTGYGKRSAREQAYEDYSSNPLLTALSGSKNIGPVANGTEYGNMLLHDYTRETPLDEWTPKVGKSDLLLAALSAQANQEAEQKKQELRDKLAIEYGAESLEGQAKLAGMKKEREIKAEADTLGYNPKKEEDVDKLRKEFIALPEAKNFAIVEKSAGIIKKAIEDSSAVSDQELVRYSVLLMEPGMSVREGEQQAMASSASIPAEWKGSLAKALSGNAQLGPEVREGMKRLAMRAYEGHREQYDRALGFYQGQAKIKGIDPSRISYTGESRPFDEVMGGGPATADPGTPPPNLTFEQFRAWKSSRGGM